MSHDLDAGALVTTIDKAETILREPTREISLLLAREAITITHARYAAGQPIAGPHVHNEHTDAFYVLEGELTFQLGPAADTITASPGDLLAVPPGVAHAFRNDSDRPARWLTIHARDGGFASFMRGLRDGLKTDWDIAPVPAHGGLPASAAILSPATANHRPHPGDPCRPRCALPELRVIEWRLNRSRTTVPLHTHHRRHNILLVLDGELHATLAGTRHTSPPAPSSPSPRSAAHGRDYHGPQPARLLSLHTTTPAQRA